MSLSYEAIRVSYQSSDHMAKSYFNAFNKIYEDMEKLLLMINEDKDKSYFICSENKEFIDNLQIKYLDR